jgi:hypothetical protein
MLPDLVSVSGSKGRMRTEIDSVMEQDGKNLNDARPETIQDCPSFSESF